MWKVLSVISAGGLFVLMSLASPSVAGTAATGTVRAIVRYETPAGDRPLVGVEVFLGTLNGGSSRYACTDANGVAIFRRVRANTHLISATGVAFSLRDVCTNPDFLNPDTGRQMTGVSWRNHHGVQTFDAFLVRAGRTFTLRFVAETPSQEARICAGLWSTWVGTSGPDRFTATAGKDVIQAGSGADRIDGVDGDDVICGGAGDDSLLGSAGNDWIFGGPGDDELVGGPGANLLFGGPGADTCQGGMGSDCEG